MTAPQHDSTTARPDEAQRYLPHPFWLFVRRLCTQCNADFTGGEDYYVHNVNGAKGCLDAHDLWYASNVTNGRPAAIHRDYTEYSTTMCGTPPWLEFGFGFGFACLLCRRWCTFNLSSNCSCWGWNAEPPLRVASSCCHAGALKLRATALLMSNPAFPGTRSSLQTRFEATTRPCRCSFMQRFRACTIRSKYHENTFSVTPSRVQMPVPACGMSRVPRQPVTKTGSPASQTRTTPGCRMLGRLASVIGF